MTSAAEQRSRFQTQCADRIYRNRGNLDLLDSLPRKPARVLDVGCGGGDNARLLRERGFSVVGVTVSAAEAELASAHCDSVIVANVERDELALPAGTFDVLLLSHVLEHMIDPRRALARLAPTLREGALAAIAVPNMAFWRVRWRLLRGDWGRDQAGWMDETHLQFWSYETAPSIVEGTPFDLVERRAGDPAVPLWPLRRLLPTVGRRIDRWLGQRLPNLSAMQVILIARKRSSDGAVESRREQ